MEWGIAEAAAASGLSPQRLRALAAQGALPARKVGGRWIFDSATVPTQARKAGRALTPLNAWRLDALARGEEIDARPEVASRLRAKVRRLSAEANPAPLLRQWLARRAERADFEASNLEAAFCDARLHLTGASSPISGLTRGAPLEAYVSSRDLPSVVRDLLLFKTRPGGGNLVLLVVPEEVPLERVVVGPLIVAADLAESPDPRAQGQVTHVLRSMVDDRS